MEGKNLDLTFLFPWFFGLKKWRFLSAVLPPFFSILCDAVCEPKKEREGREREGREREKSNPDHEEDLKIFLKRE